MAETTLRRILTVADKKVSRAAFGGSLLSVRCVGGRGSRTEEVLRTSEGLADRIGDLLLLKAEQLSLFSPVDRYLRCQSHQLLGSELRRVLAVDYGCDDVGRQRGKTQQATDVRS